MICCHVIFFHTSNTQLQTFVQTWDFDWALMCLYHLSFQCEFILLIHNYMEFINLMLQLPLCIMFVVRIIFVWAHVPHLPWIMLVCNWVFMLTPYPMVALTHLSPAKNHPKKHLRVSHLRLKYFLLNIISFLERALSGWKG